MFKGIILWKKAFVDYNDFYHITSPSIELCGNTSNSILSTHISHITLCFICYCYLNFPIITSYHNITCHQIR